MLIIEHTALNKCCNFNIADAGRACKSQALPSEEEVINRSRYWIIGPVCSVISDSSLFHIQSRECFQPHESSQHTRNMKKDSESLDGESMSEMMSFELGINTNVTGTAMKPIQLTCKYMICISSFELNIDDYALLTEGRF